MDADDTATLRDGQVVWFALLILAFGAGYFLGTSPWTMEGPSPSSQQSGGSLLRDARSAPARDPSSDSENASPTLASLPLPNPPEWATSHLPISQLGMRNAVENVLATDDPFHRQFLFSQLLTRLHPDNAAGLWTGLTVSPRASEDPSGMRNMLGLFGHVWGQIDGQAAMEQALKEGGPWGKTLANHALKSWARTKASAAVEWSTLESRSLDRSLRLSLLDGLAEADLPMATSYFNDLVERTDARVYVQPIIEAQLEIGIEAAEGWIAESSSVAIKESGLRHIADTLSKEDIDRAAAWVEPFAEESYGGKAVAVVADALIKASLGADDDVKKVTDWLGRLPEGDAKEAAYGQALRSWARQRPNEAAEYLGALPDSPAKNKALRSFAMEVTSRDPEAAVLWASTISDREVRENTLRITARHWHRTDPRAAEAWLNEAGLPPKTVAEIIDR